MMFNASAANWSALTVTGFCPGNIARLFMHQMMHMTPQIAIGNDTCQSPILDHNGNAEPLGRHGD
jgi:hypothetical protein